MPILPYPIFKHIVNLLSVFRKSAVLAKLTEPGTVLAANNYRPCLKACLPSTFISAFVKVCFSPP